ncbi:unnamed protein product [Acanthosepion pharaonis]|uniref:Uncharacterized protein n=1 Tax=Acanthosepion pharaonis TaxID=158019 RepID=A0A812EL65_ACAPH|nr:unnamed protein product [Sepia pharaonis]
MKRPTVFQYCCYSLYLSISLYFFILYNDCLLFFSLRIFFYNLSSFFLSFCVSFELSLSVSFRIFLSLFVCRPYNLCSFFLYLTPLSSLFFPYLFLCLLCSLFFSLFCFYYFKIFIFISPFLFSYFDFVIAFFLSFFLSFLLCPFSFFLTYNTCFPPSLFLFYFIIFIISSSLLFLFHDIYSFFLAPSFYSSLIMAKQ